MRNKTFDWNRILWEGTVERFLRNIQRDAKRSLRNLVDLSLNFSRDRLTRYFLNLLQAMLKNGDSAYFEAAQALTNTVDMDTLKIVAVNLALEGCSRGGEKIREQEALRGHNIPWALTLCVGSQGLSPEDCLCLVAEGTSLGINTYLLLDCNLTQEGLRQLAEAYPKCTFVVFDRQLCRQAMVSLQELHNVLYLVDLDGAKRDQALENLKKGRFLYGFYRRYNEETAEACSNGEALDNYREGEAPVICLIPEPGTSSEAQILVSDRAVAQRMEQSYPYCLLELGQDLIRVDTLLSEGACSLAICPDGQAVSLQGRLEGEAYNVYHHSLGDILALSAPKKEG